MSAAPRANAYVYLLADHLDAMLSIGEDLTAIPALVPDTPTEGSADSIWDIADERRRFVESIRALEARLVSRLLLARDHAEVARRSDRRFKPIAELFLSGTLVVVDAAADLGDSATVDFHSGEDTTAFLRNRGVITAEATSGTQRPPLSINEEFLIAGTIQLGALLDLAAAFLDALEIHYVLYADAVRPERADADGPVASTNA